MAGQNNCNEPQPDRWYNLVLGDSYKEEKPSKFCTLRYDFKPASVNKDQRGSLHKRQGNKATVEFQNNQPGKSKVIFEGITEDCKETDAILFFDGETLRLERVTSNVNRLKLKREGEPSATGVPERNSPPLGRGNKPQPSNKDSFHSAHVEVERIEVGEFKAADAQPRYERTVEYPAAQAYSSNPSPEELDIVNNDDDAIAAPMEVNEIDSRNVEVTEYETGNVEVMEYDTGIDINKPQADVDDEVDLIDDGEDKGPSAAEALKATLGSAACSSDDSSGSSSGSGSSSSDGESSDGDTVNSI